MRSFLVGLACLLLATAGAFAQVTGFVESIGYNNSFRPDCWTSLLVNLRSQVSEPMSYQLQIWQEDMDKDRVVYTKDITLSPSAQDKFQLYFIPRPTDDGLPPTPAELQRAVQVRICLPPKPGQRPEDARVLIDRLPIQFGVTNVDPPRDYSLGGTPLGKRLVLWVGDSGSTLQQQGYVKALGLTQQVEFVSVPVTELGENVLYYNGIDAVLWLGANADNLDRGGARRLEALEQYVREGGHLVVCQPGERGKIVAFAGLLPIELKDAADNWLVELRDRPALRADQDVLPRLAKPRWEQAEPESWSKVKGPIAIAFARQLKPDAVIDGALQYWDDAKTQSSPFIVRHGYGLGAVTWVAQDLGNPNLSLVSERWPYVWEHVFGWNDDTHVSLDMPDVDLNAAPRIPPPGRRGVSMSAKVQSGTMSAKSDYSTQDSPVDLGRSLLKGMDFQAKGAAYIFVAILFFIGYWIVAGPGTYLFLSNKKKREWNWFVFGLWAFVATALTLGVVRVLLRGSPEIRHQTIVRMAAGQQAFIHSRIGLYIPRDGYQTIELKDAAKDAISYITPFNIHPAYWTPTEYPSAQDYAIPVHDDPQPVRVEIPYRSTLKKLQARWVGELPGGIAGTASLVASDKHIAGKLTNQTGTDLANIYFVFNFLKYSQDESKPVESKDFVLKVPEWRKDQTLDLKAEYNDFATMLNAANASGKKNQYESIDHWGAAWARGYSSSGVFTQSDTRGDDFESPDRKSFPIMSLIDRIPPDKNSPLNGDGHQRVEYLRRGGHDLNLSSAVAAGELVILAESKEHDRPLPFPLLVEGDKVAGEGVILYQFVLPLDRTEMLKALEEDKDKARAQSKAKP